MHLNHNLLCPKHLEAYFAVEIKLSSATAQKKATVSAGIFKFNNNNSYCISCSSSIFGSTGIDVLVKQKHLHWSPAAIKSALMTTSTTLDRADRPLQAQQYSESGTMSLVHATPFNFGSGHVNPRELFWILDSSLMQHSPKVAGGGGGFHRSCKRLSSEVEEICGGGKFLERKYG
ncbi:putative Subtilisin-like serine protease 3 [Abeliophyllum distichum]|uniref:Subtilisin-like serine protease 3 n=1 Tax=Abeliophyllum distichum TaxID=126358 RepID=A0ABD1UII4_9LAMI